MFGLKGQLGVELAQSLAPLGRVTALGREDADLADSNGLRDLLRHHRPDLVVNAAAYTAVDRAESEETVARRINAVAVGVMAQEVERLGVPLLHYSTDYVFDGASVRPYTEDDPPNPLNAYGRTKLEGEELIRRYCRRHLIFRISWVYSGHGRNFVRTMLRLGREREELSVVADQHGAPTPARLVADVSAVVLRDMLDAPSEASRWGLYHLAPGGVTTWHGLAESVFRLHREFGGTELAIRRVHPIGTSDYPTPARRPANSRLDTLRLRETFQLNLPTWQECLHAVLMSHEQSIR